MVLNDERTGLVPLGQALEARVLEIRDSLQSQGRLDSTERPVDWMSGDGQRRLDWLMRISGVPEEYRTPELSRCRVKTDLEEYLADLPARMQRGEGMILFGPTGTGKSSTAALVVQAVVKQKSSARWSYVPDLCDLLLDSRRRAEIRAQQSEVDLLVWDDFGARPLSDFEIGLLDQVVERRYRRRRAMVVAMNQTSEQIKTDPRLTRMVDRWRQRNRALVIGGASMRKFGA
jgi:DNA replication protein DnaC